MLILVDVGLQIRLSGVNRLLGWICNPTVMSISIFNAKICFAYSNGIYKRIANAYTRCRRITNPTKRLFNVQCRRK